jgi:hypothetical protein
MPSHVPLFMRSNQPRDADQRMCAVCRSAINTGDPRYRIGEAEYHPACFKSWLNVPMTRE